MILIASCSLRLIYFCIFFFTNAIFNQFFSYFKGESYILKFYLIWNMVSLFTKEYVHALHYLIGILAPDIDPIICAIFLCWRGFCQIWPYLQGTQAGGASMTVKPGTMAILPQQNVPLQTIHALQSKGAGQTNLMTTPVQLQQNLKSVR